MLAGDFDKEWSRFKNGDVRVLDHIDFSFTIIRSRKGSPKTIAPNWPLPSGEATVKDFAGESNLTCWSSWAKTRETNANQRKKMPYQVRHLDILIIILINLFPCLPSLPDEPELFGPVSASCRRTEDS